MGGALRGFIYTLFGEIPNQTVRAAESTLIAEPDMASLPIVQRHVILYEGFHNQLMQSRQHKIYTQHFCRLPVF